MISVSSAENIILAHAKMQTHENCALPEAVGRVLAEDLRSDRDQPSFDKALMDGIVIAYASWKQGRKEYIVAGTIAAGAVPGALRDQKCCWRIMTGAVVPKGGDCVIPVEWIRFQNGTVTLKEGVQLKVGQFIRFKGKDVKKNDLLLKKGVVLEAPHIGILASCGKASVKVYRRPRAAIIATGNELVDIDKPVKAYQTRCSNSYALHALLSRASLARTQMFHVPDDPKLLKTKIGGILKTHDVLVLSGGVSMGDFDYVPRVLKELKVKCLFSSVVQKPGKPFWFGVTARGQVVFALPGNPVSALICAYRYLMPFLNKTMGVQLKKSLIAVKNLPVIKSDLTHFLLVKNGQWIDSGGSGDFAALAKADGFIEYECHKQEAVWPYFSWRV